MNKSKKIKYNSLAGKFLISLATSSGLNTTVETATDISTTKSKTQVIIAFTS